MIKYSHGCTLDCADCCKFDVFTENNKIVKIEGDKNHPYTNGLICNKGRAHLSRLNHENRIYKPLLKVNNQWIEISFEEAVKLVGDKIIAYKNKYSSQSIMYYEQYGNGSLLKSIGEVFFNFLGGATLAKGGPCWSAGIAAQKLDFGNSLSHPLDDMLNSNTIIVWGKNPANTTIHTMKILMKAKKYGKKIVVIDPVRTTTAKLANIYIPIKPNGDLSLALAMAKLIIEKKYLDIEYVSKYVDGFDEYKNVLNSINIDKLIEECGIKFEKINELVDLYCNKYSTILLGYGLQKYKNGGNTIRAIDALGAITGQIGFKGGGINYANKVYPSILNLDPFNSSSYSDNRYFYTSKVAEFIDECNNSKDIAPIKMAIITKSNMLNQLADLNSVINSFKSIEFKVCFDMFFTDTAKECDLFIPTTSTLESEDLLFSSMQNPYLILNEKIIEPNDKLMDEYHFFQTLAINIGLDKYPKCIKRDYLIEVLKPLNNIINGFNIDMLKKEYINMQKSIPWEDKIFSTNSKKFTLKVDYLDKPITDDTRIRLLTNHSKDTLSSQHFMDNNKIAIAHINSKQAQRHNIINDEIVTLKSIYGEIKVTINVDDNIGDNISMMYVGWWKKSGNPNYLTSSEISDIGGQITYNETFIEIIKNN